VQSYRAFRIHEQRAGVEALALESPSTGEVLIRVHWSGINYKDALAVTGKGKIVRRFPLTGGVDLSGVVEASGTPEYSPGDAVLVTGCGLSEVRDGGYAEYARVPAEAVIRLPANFSLRDVMVMGTAGFAAALAIHQLEHNGLAPGAGPVAVTGASGGVGCIAVDMLSHRGYEVVAFTRKPEAASLLKELGASEVRAFDAGTRPLEPERWAGAIDNVGGEVLSTLLRSTQGWGGVAAVGLAGGAELNVSLMPFLLRGVNLLGVNSAATRRDKRELLWQRIATDLAPRHLERIATASVGLDELPAACAKILSGVHIGRTLVRLAA
jgi:NADPH2:quinone reductase